MKPINPTKVWLSEHILLSDLVGCDSVYRHGIANPVYDTDRLKLDEGHYLADMLEILVEERAVSFTYGYICPALSQAIVKYQDPRKPSYHRWDKGAACDMIVHTPEAMFQNPSPNPPEAERLHLAWGHYPLDELSLMYTEEGIRWSRAITYAESEVFCFATQKSEGDEFRMATYENRYMGKGKKPWFNKIPEATIQSGDFSGPQNWRGRGWPHTHGNGRRQYEHVRTGIYSVLSDYLYDAVCVHKGIPNRPPIGRRSADRFMLNVMLAGVVYEQVMRYADTRVPIVGAYVNPAARHTQIDRSYHDHFVLDLAVPENTDVSFIMEAAEGSGAVKGTGEMTGKVRIIGKSVDKLNCPEIITASSRLEYERQFFLKGIRS